MHRNVLQVDTQGFDLDRRELAVLLELGPDAVLSHHSAARRLGLDLSSFGSVHALLPRRHPRRRLTGAVLSRSLDLSPADVITRGLVRFTNAPRTLLDLAATLDALRLRTVVDSALRRDPSVLQATLARIREVGSGKHGVPELRTLLLGYEHDDVPDSGLESLAVHLTQALRCAPALHHWVFEGDTFIAEVDLGFTDCRLAVELDSWKHHGSREAQRRDRRRDRALRDAGWEPRRYDWKDVSADREGFIRDLEGALARRRIELASRTRSTQEPGTTSANKPPAAPPRPPPRPVVEPPRADPRPAAEELPERARAPVPHPSPPPPPSRRTGSPPSTTPVASPPRLPTTQLPLFP